MSQRLTVAVEEIIVMFERTLTEYEEEIDRHRRLLAAEPLSGVTVTINAGTGLSSDFNLTETPGDKAPGLILLELICF